MVAFWKDVAAKAPHHSRASWMKFWRRHKHELDPSDGDEPLPAPPDKKMRYSKDDDILLAKYFHHRPEGTSDKIFQAFGRLVGLIQLLFSLAWSLLTLLGERGADIVHSLASPSSLERLAGTSSHTQNEDRRPHGASGQG